MADAGVEARAAQQRAGQLEEELATLRAQADAAAINFEQASQAMEQRYSALSEEYDKLSEQKQKLAERLAEANQELTQVKSANHKLQTQIVEKDAALEQQAVKLAEMQSDIRRLLRLSEQKDAQLVEQQQQVSSYMSKLQGVTDERVELSTRLAAAERVSSQAAAMKERLEQEKANLEKHNKWLVEELDRKADDMLASSRATAEQLAEARAELKSSKLRVSQLEGSESSLKERVEELGAEYEALQRRHMETEQQLVAEVAHLKRELATSNKLAGLRKEGAEAAKKRTAELEGIIRAMTEQTAQVVQSKDNAYEKELELRKSIEDQYNQLQERFQAVMNACNEGRPLQRELDFSQVTPGIQPSPASLRSPTPPSTYLSSDMTATELYSKYAMKAEECRQERGERRRLEKIMDEMVRQVEIRAAAMKEQEVEHDRIMQIYQAQQDSLAAADRDRDCLESEKAQLSAQLQKLEKDRSRLDQIIKDTSLQVQHLLWENQQLSGAHGSGATPPATASAAGGPQDAGDVITERLVSFSGVKELQQRNQHLLALTRDLADQLETKEKQLQESLDAEVTKRTKTLQGQLEELVGTRKHQQELVDQIIRQRDLYRDMLSRTSTDSNAGKQPDLGTSLTAATQVAAALTVASPAQQSTSPSPEYKALYEDTAAELEKIRKEAAENVSMLQQEKSSMQDELARLRMEANQATASMTFERERYERLVISTDANRKELQSLLSRNLELSELLRERERRLREATTELEGSHAAAGRDRQRLAALEAEKAVLAAAEARASAEATELSREKFRLAAMLESTQKLADHQQQEFHKERERLTAEAQRMTHEWNDIQKVLISEKATATSAARALDETKKVADEYKAKAESFIASLQEAKSMAEQRAAVAEGKVEVLNASLKKAEERAASLASAHSSASAMVAHFGSPGFQGRDGQQEASRATELVILKQELAAAQEAAAAAAGHMAQYKAIAASSDEALQAMQQAHEAFKADAKKASAAAEANLMAMQDKLDTMQKELAASQEAQKVAQAKLDDLEDAIQRETAPLKAQLQDAEQNAARMSGRVKALEGDVEQHHKSWRTAQQMYEQELMQHAEKVKALNAAEAELEQVRQQLEAAAKSKADLEGEVAGLKAEVVAINAAHKSAKAEAEARAKELSAHNAELHNQLEKLAQDTQKGQSSTEESSGQGSASSMAEVVKYLRREKETAECQLALLQQESARWQQQAAIAEKAAAQARQQLEAGLQRSRENVQTAEEHKELLAKVRHMNLLTESNDMLRAECEGYVNKYKAAKEEAAAAAKEADRMAKRLREVEAEVQAKASEVSMSKEEAKRWEARSQELLQKMQTVDPREHQRVCDELKALKESSAASAAAAAEAKKALEEELEKTKATLAKSQSQERIAKKQIMGTFNPTKLPIAEWVKQREAKDAKMAELEKKVAELEEANKKSLAAASKVAKPPPEPLPPPGMKQTQAIAALQAQKAKLTEENATLKEQVAKAVADQPQARAASGEIAMLKEQLAKAEQDLQEHKAMLEKMTQQRDNLAKSHTVLKASYDRAKATLQKAAASKKVLESQIKEKDDKIEALEKGRAAAAADPPAAPPAAVAAPSDAAMAPGEKISDADALRARVEEAIKAAKAAADGPEDAKEVPPAALVEEAQEVSVPSDPTCFTPPATPPDTMSPSADAAADSFLEDMAFSPANLQQGCEMPGPAAATDDAEAVACGTAHQNAAWGGEGGMAGHSRPVEGSEEAPPAKRARKFPADAAPEAVQGEHPADASDLIKSSEGVDSAVGKPAEGAPGEVEMTDAGAPELPEAVAPPAGETAADAPNQPPSSSPDVAIEDAPALEEVEDAAEDGEIMPAEGDWPGQVEVTGTQPAPTTEAGTVAAPAASSAPPAVQGGAKRRTIQWPADGPPRVNKPEAPAAGGATPETPAPGAVRQGPPGLSSAGMKTATAAAAAAAAAAASASMAASSGGFLQQPVADSTVQPSPGRGSAAAGAAPGAAAVSPQPQAARGGRSVRGTERVTTRGQTRGRGRIAKGSGGRGAPPGGSGPSA